MGGCDLEMTMSEIRMMQHVHAMGGFECDRQVRHPWAVPLGRSAVVWVGMARLISYLMRHGLEHEQIQPLGTYTGPQNENTTSSPLAKHGKRK